MKVFLRSALRVLAQLGLSLQQLKASLRGLMPRPAPVLVPIPIRAERRTRGPLVRPPYRDY